MRCPQCGVEQPLGVTVCGFCGALMVRGAPALRSEDAEAFHRGAAQASRAARSAGRWLVLIGAALAVGLLAGWIVYRTTVQPSAEPAVASEPATMAPEAEPARASDGSAGAAGAPAAEVVRGGGTARLDDEQLHRFAEQIASAAERGDARWLVARVDARARYRLRLEDAFERRELSGGKPELLAHWLAPWLVSEIYGGSVDESIELDRVAVDFDLKRGLITRRVETAGDVSRLRFPRALLEPLALRGTLDLELAGRLDLSPLRIPTVLCSALETVRVATGPTGLRVVEVERTGRCRRLD
jgi:hypothetical protein